MLEMVYGMKVERKLKDGSASIDELIKRGVTFRNSSMAVFL